jgi:uncharacterized coiled-coil DUF342 family protein
MSQAMFPVPQEGDTLSSLEERIQRAVQLVARLRRERDAALAEAAAAKAALAEATGPHSESVRLAEEVRTLQAERQQVRGRIERLLSQIDEISAG